MADQQTPTPSHNGEAGWPGRFAPARLVRSGRGVKQVNQAAALQRFAFDAVQALQRSLTKNGVLTVTRDDAQALSQLVKSWDIAANRLRVLRGRGLPASVRASKPRSAGPVQPLEPA